MQKHTQLTVEVHPILYAYLTKGFPSKRMKWSWKYKQKIRVKQNSNYHLTEFHFYDRNEFFVFESESTNQDGAHVCTGTWTCIVRGG